MERFYFSAKLSSQRVWLNNGNVELYSLYKSFENGVMWKFTIAPTASLDVEGYVEKTQNGQVVRFEANEATSAINGNFLHVQNVAQHFALRDFSVFKGKYIAFTLAVFDNLINCLIIAGIKPNPQEHWIIGNF